MVLRDGSVAHVRPITPDDADGIREFHAGQSDESIYMRFFAPLRELSHRDVERFTVVDYDDRVALVVTLRDHIIGIGRYDKVDRTTAEVAFNISDHYQGKGIGSVLLEHLSAIGHEAGLTRFIAEVLPRNRKMLTSSRRRATTSSTAWRTASSSSPSTSRPRHSRRRCALPASTAPRRSACAASSPRRQWRSSEPAGGSTRWARPCCATCSRASSPARCMRQPGDQECAGLPCYPDVMAVPDEVDLAIIACPPPWSWMSG